MTDTYDARLPLTAAQQDLWFAHQLDPHSAAYTIGEYADIQGHLDAALLRRAVAHVTEETDALRVEFREGDDGPRQLVTSGTVIDVPLIDLATRPDAYDTAVARMHTDLARTVDPASAPLVNMVLYRLAPERHLFYLRVHHLALDGYGAALVVSRIALIQPLMFVLLLAYVFGGSLGGDGYRTFLMGGIFAQAVTFNASFTALGLASDMDKGIIDRFRALPMPRGSVILGRTLSDLVMSAVTLAVTSLCGLLIGWRVESGPARAVQAYLLILVFAFAMSWVGATIGLTARSVEVAQSAGLIWLFPVTFVSVAAMPGPLQTLAEWNPVSATATAARSLFGNTAPPAVAPSTAWPAQHAPLYAALCALALIALFMPLAVRRYRAVAHA